MIVTPSRKGVNFIADHMPPQAVTKQMNEKWYRKWFGIVVKQRFFPQCIHCSGVQGGLLGRASSKGLEKGQFILRRKRMPNLKHVGGGKNAYFHGLTFRKEFLTGGVLAYATVSDAKEQDILGNGGGNRGRFEEWQWKANEVVLNLLQRFGNF